MKKLSIWMILALLLGGMFQACNNDKTYAEMKEEEEEMINRFIEKNEINVISMEQFIEQDSTTDVSKNEYVLFPDKGVYMQVVNRGEGNVLEDGNYVVLIRYQENRIYTNGTDTIQSATSQGYPDEISVTKKGNSYSATFDSNSMMYSYYSSASVPSGWLLPLDYLKLGKVADDTRAHVKLIVPHSQGQSDASMYVYPCFYDIKYQLPRNQIINP